MDWETTEICLFCEPSFSSQQESGGGISKDIKKKTASGKYAVIKTIFIVFFGCATANQYVTTTGTEKTTAWEPKASQFHTYLQTAEYFNADILS